MNSILHYRYRVPKPFASYFPSETSPLALDLISKMLQFHPDDRISVESALEHPYLAEYHIQMPEPVCQDLFNFEFEKVNYDLSSEDVQLLMYEEMLLYRPSATQFPRDADNGNIIDMAGNNCTPLYWTALHSTVLHSTVLHCTLLLVTVMSHLTLTRDSHPTLSIVTAASGLCPVPSLSLSLPLSHSFSSPDSTMYFSFCPSASTCAPPPLPLICPSSSLYSTLLSPSALRVDCTSSVCSESSMGSEETFLQGTTSNSNSNMNTKSKDGNKTRKVREKGEKRGVECKDSAQYGVVNQKALDALNAQYDRHTGYAGTYTRHVRCLEENVPLLRSMFLSPVLNL